MTQNAAAKPRPFRLQSPPPLREAHVVEACCDLLRAHGMWPKRNHVAKLKTPDGRWIQLGEKGEPDWVVLGGPIPGGFLLEVKRPGGELSPEQVIKIEQLRRGYRLTVAVVDSVHALGVWLEAHGVKVFPPKSKPPDDKSGGDKQPFK